MRVLVRPVTQTPTAARAVRIAVPRSATGCVSPVGVLVPTWVIAHPPTAVWRVFANPALPTVADVATGPPTAAGASATAVLWVLAAPARGCARLASQPNAADRPVRLASPTPSAWKEWKLFSAFASTKFAGTIAAPPWSFVRRVGVWLLPDAATTSRRRVKPATTATPPTGTNAPATAALTAPGGVPFGCIVIAYWRPQNGSRAA